MNVLQKYWLLTVLCLFPWLINAQQDCKDGINYSISNVTVNGAGVGHLINENQSMQITIGQPYVGPSGSFSQGISSRSGFWGFYELEPQGPRAVASEGEFLDRIEIEWEVVDDRKGPVVTEDITKIYRNGKLLTSVPIGQTSYVDHNVFPGEFYTYGIVTSNSLGDGKPVEVVGFLNPNGRVTGKIETRNGSPVSDVKVVLSPNLGRSLDLDGTDDYMYFVDQAYDFGDYYTIEGWWRNVDVQQQTLFVAVDSGTTVPMIKVSLDVEGKLHYYHDGNADGTGLELVSKNGYNLTAETRDWHHFAAVYDTTNVYLYVDGNRIAETPVTEPISEIAEIEIGKDGPKQYSGYYSGFLDEFRIWNVGRTRAQIRKFKDITLTGLEQYLQSYWKFDEQFSDKIFDFSDQPVEEREHGYICDVTRSDFISPAQLGAYTDEGGDYIIKGVFYGDGQTFSVIPSKETPIGFSLDFDGTDDFISYQLDRLEYNNAFTLEGWFKTAASGQNMVIYEATNATTNDVLIQLGLQGTGEFYASAGFSGSLATVISTDQYNDEFWYHYAVTHDGANVSLYIDGVLVGSALDATISNVNTRYVIGRSDPIEFNAGSNYFNGSLDEMRLWDHVRTLNQINGTLNQIIPGNEQGIVDPEGTQGVLAYWMMGEGQGNIISDATPDSHIGELKNFQEVEISPGEFRVANWNGDDIPLDVEFFSHDFDPNARNVSLDPSNTSVDRVDFADISQLGVSGFIKYAGTNCFADSVEILVNGASAFPSIFSDEAGKFTVEFEPGLTSQILSFKLGEHSFDPGFIELPTLVRPIAGLEIKDTQVRNFKGRVVGGQCGYPIGDAEVVVSTSPFCYSDTVSVDNQGNFEFLDIPPLQYIVSVIHSDPVIQTFFDQQGAENIDLKDANQELDFIYRAPLNIEITGLEAETCSAAVLEQNKESDISIRVYEDYSGNQCDIESGTLTVNDNISDRDQTSFDFSSATSIYKLKPGEPNILSGGSNEYQKNIQVVAEDTLGRQTDITLWAFVTGNKPRSVDFATTTPEIPFIILRAPPGDQSGATLEKGTTMGSSASFSAASESSSSGSLELKLGQSFKTQAGSPFFSVGTEIERELTYTQSFEVTESLLSSTETSFEFTSTDAFNTEGTSDIYVGGALNMLYGITDILTIDETCTAALSEEVIFAPDGFNTTFVYSQDFIEQTVIPELVSIGDDKSANTWQSFIDLNNDLKSKAQFVENISFDASSSFERIETTTQSESRSVEFEMNVQESVAVAAGFTVNGSGVSGEVGVTFGMSLGSSQTVDRTVERSVSFNLADDDFGDNYTINILKDPVYATPVFELVSSATSCPWEGGLKREAVKLNVDRNQAINVPEDQPAVFNLLLGNISETRESGTYNLTLLAESNPNGAVVKVNGVALSGEQDITFTLQPDEQIETTLTIEKGPTAFDYSGLQMMLYSACEKEWADFRGFNIPEEPFASIQSLDVSFIEVCSPITIFDPGDDWVITQANDNSMNVTLTDYIIDRVDFTEVKLQYRQKIEGQPWINAVETPKDDLSAGTTILEWDVTNLDDGNYELRALTFCDAVPDPRSSEILTGTIDRGAPTLLGTPSPVDAILERDDQISIEFNENLQCGDLITLSIPVSLVQGELNNVALSNTETGLYIDATVSCDGNKLIIVPDIQNKFIEEQVLRVDVLGMKDELGNLQTQTITWEFLVRRNPLEWLGGDIQAITNEGQSASFIRQVKNNGAFDVNVNLSGKLDVQTLNETNLPSWLNASPLSFTLTPAGTQDVIFTVSDQLSGGQFNDVVTAATSFGAPELNLDVRVLCPDPGWIIDPSNFENSMTLSAELIVDGNVSNDEFDIVAAFVGDELRGIGSPEYVQEIDAYQLFLTVYSNNVTNEDIVFSVWDASECKLFAQTLESYDFGANAVLGTPSNPVPISTTANLIREFDLSSGWSWISLNLDLTDGVINTVLSELNPTQGDIIKSQTQFAQYTNTLGWVGTLSTLENTSMYQINLSDQDALKYAGVAVDVETTFIDIHSGWNWISYLPQSGLDVNTALASLNPITGDLIKNQTDFAQYVENVGWIGSLDFLRPDDGYLLNVANAGALEYPIVVSGRFSHDTKPNTMNIDFDPGAFEYSMTVTAVLEHTGIQLSSGDDAVLMFKDDELRGYGVARRIDILDETLFFITGYSNDAAEESFNFKWLNGSSDQIIDIEESFKLGANAQIGLPTEPIELHASNEITSLKGLTHSEFGIGPAYPNPFSNTTTINYKLNQGGETSIIVYDVLGQVVAVLFSEYQASGNYAVEWNGRGLNSQKVTQGIYMVRLVSGESEQTIRLVVKP